MPPHSKSCRGSAIKPGRLTSAHYGGTQTGLDHSLLTHLADVLAIDAFRPRSFSVSSLRAASGPACGRSWEVPRLRRSCGRCAGAAAWPRPGAGPAVPRLTPTSFVAANPTRRVASLEKEPPALSRSGLAFATVVMLLIPFPNVRPI